MRCKKPVFSWQKAALALLLIGVFLIGEIGLADFTDTVGHWAESVIDKWNPIAIVTGDSNYFRPDDAITRGEVAILLHELMQYPEGEPTSFYDLGDDFYSEALSRVAAQGIILGYDGYARPLDPLTRQEMAVVLARAFGITAEGIPSFDDTPLIASWASASIAALQQAGILQGYAGRFEPLSYTTRAEMIQMLENMVSMVYHAATIEAAGMLLRDRVHSGNLLLTDNGVLENVSIDGDLILSTTINELIILHNVYVTGQVIHMGQARVLQTGSTAVIITRTSDSGVDKPIEEEPNQGEEPNQEQDGYIPEVKDYIDYYGGSIAVQQGVPLNSLDPRGFTTKNGLPAYEDSNGNRALLGVDVSAWQQNIDWAAVKAAGIEFAMLRVGGRGYGSGKLYDDTWFEANVKGATENGIEIGVYFFSQAISVAEALEEAEFVLNAISGHTITYPVTFDWELIGTTGARTDKVTSATATAAAKAFCQAIETAGYRAAVYLYTETALKLYHLIELAEYEFWFAKYQDRPDFYYKMNMWQFTSGGKVNGISGKCDMNLYFPHVR